MAVICTVRIPHDLEKVQRVEEANPEVMNEIMGAAMKYMTSHRRTATDGEVMDLDEFASRADYDKFIAEAGPAIHKWGELLGAPGVDTVYDVIEGG
jgi:hypothetical protein